MTNYGNYIDGTYGLKYWHQQTEYRTGTLVRLEIHQRGYTGTSYEMGEMAALSLEIQGAQDSIIAPIVKTALHFTFVDTEGVISGDSRKHGGWREFYTPDATLYLVKLYRGGTLEWSGYLTPDSYSEGLQAVAPVSFTARDNIGHLADFSFYDTAVGNDTLTVGTLVSYALREINLALDYVENVSASGAVKVIQDSASGTSLLNALVNVSQFKSDDWYTVLETVLADLGLTLRYVGGNKVCLAAIRSLPRLGGTTVKSTGTDKELVFLSGGTRSIDPAYKQIVEQLPYDYQSSVELNPAKGLTYGSATTYNHIPYNVPATQGHAGYQVTETATGCPVSNSGEGWHGPAFLNLSTYPLSPNVIRYGGDKGAVLVANLGTAVDRYYSQNVAHSGVTVQLGWLRAALRINLGTVDPLYAGNAVENAAARAARLSYRIAFISGGTTYYWDGEQWSNSLTDLEATFAYENGWMDNFAVQLTDAADGAEGELRIYIRNFVFVQKGYITTQAAVTGWADGVQSDSGYSGRYVFINALVLDNQATVLSGNRVTTIANTAFNVTLERSPELGCLSADYGRINNHTYENVLYRSASGKLVPFGYNVKWSGAATSFPFPVLIHLQILAYYISAMEVLEGWCERADEQPFAFNQIYSYKGGRYLLLSGTLDLISGRLEGGIFRTFYEYDDIWEDSSSDMYQTPSYTVDAGAAGTTGGSSSGGSSGGSGSSGGGSVASSLGGLSDVTLSSPSDGQTLIYSSAAGGWVNAYGQLVKLSDVNISSPSDGQVLTYNSSTGKWVNATPASTGGDEVSLAAPVIQIYSGYSESASQSQFSPYLQATHPAKDSISGAQFVLMKWGRRRGRIGATSTKQYATNRKGWGEARGGVHTEGISFSDTYLLSNLRNFICQHYCVIYGSNTRPTWATLKATAKSTKVGFGGHKDGDTQLDMLITGHTKLFGVALRWENPEWTALGLTGTIEDSTCEVDGVKRWLYSEVAPLRVFVTPGKTYWSMGFSQDTSLYHYGMATRKQLEAVADEIGNINTLLAAI